MASSCIACCIFHIISIPFNCLDTALRVPMLRWAGKLKIFVFRYVCFVGSLTFSHLDFSYESKAKFSPVNRADMKRPSVMIVRDRDQV